MRGGESAIPLPSPTICGGPPSPRGRGLFFWMMDSATSPSASRRMTGGGGRHAVKSGSFGLENPTERRSVSMWIDLLMMLCVLVLDCCHVHRFWIDSCL